MNRYSSIKGFTDNLRMPRLGKVRLGIKVLNDAQTHTFPKETKHFVCPPEVQDVYGETPTEIDIVFPTDLESEACPQAYKWYAGPSLRCKGDGVTALRVAGALGEQGKTVNGPIPADPTALVEIACPCPLLNKDPKTGRSKCNLVGTLSYMIPRVSMAGIYQTDIRGINSIQNINAGLALARSVAGRIAMIHFKLKRVPQEIQYQGKTATHYILRLEHQLNLEQIRRMRGSNFMIGFEPTGRVDNKAVEFDPPPPDAVEDVTPRDPNAKVMDMYIAEVKSPEEIEGLYQYIITGQEDPEKDTPILEFGTDDLAHAKMAWELVKERCSAKITYRILLAGHFQILSIEKGVPF